VNELPAKHAWWDIGFWDIGFLPDSAPPDVPGPALPDVPETAARGGLIVDDDALPAEHACWVIGFPPGAALPDAVRYGVGELPASVGRVEDGQTTNAAGYYAISRATAATSRATAATSRAKTSRTRAPCGTRHRRLQSVDR